MLVHRVLMRDPSDASAVLQLIDDRLIAAHEIVAIFGKTEGNGCVNDSTRGYATMALSVALAKPLGGTRRGGARARRDRDVRRHRGRVVAAFSCVCRSRARGGAQ
jgi:hypothetical protein